MITNCNFSNCWLQQRIEKRADLNFDLETDNLLQADSSQNEMHITYINFIITKYIGDTPVDKNYNNHFINKENENQGLIQKMIWIWQRRIFDYS